MLLNQVIAVLKGAKTRAQSILTESHKTLQKEALFEGLNRSFEKTKADYPDLPDENKPIQARADELIKDAIKSIIPYLDTQATLDEGNTTARADIIVDEKILLSKVPVTFLLVLEKELTDLHTFVSKLPLLDVAKDWEPNQDVTGFFRTRPVKTIRTQKMQKALLKYPATPEHPAQTEIITEDDAVGYWVSVHISAAIPRPIQKKMIERVEKLQHAVKLAREEANSGVVSEVKAGGILLNYIFKEIV